VANLLKPRTPEHFLAELTSRNNEIRQIHALE
jgi:hypothetical protein